ncbi:MAG: ATP-binding protein, partial [Myxococcota bacterium]|nr:ATP-binding protein [Myxococcota bacterium]
SLLAAVLSVLAFDFFFIPPFFSFAVTDLSHTVTFSVMFIVAVVISHLTKRIRQQADSARERERHTASLYAVSRELALAQSQESLLATAARHIREAFDAKVAVLLPGRAGALELALADEGTLVPGDSDFGVADWVWQHQRPAGAGTDTLPSARSLFYPLKGSRDRVGVLAVIASAPRLRGADGRQLLDTIANLTGSALERTQLAEEARQAALRIETEQLRNALLSSVSHDFRTPLAVVTGATSALLDQSAPVDEAVRRDLLKTAHEEALRLNRLVGNVLDMTRLEAGALKVHKDLQPIEEVIGSALNRLDDRLADRVVRTSIPADLPLVPLDSALIEQVLINLVENATKYTPPGSPLDVNVRALAGEVQIDVADKGPGVAPIDRERVFDKFYRAREREGGGVGLGLTICRGIVGAHGGHIWVDDRPGGGAVFRFTLPLQSCVAAAAEPVLPERELI